MPQYMIPTFRERLVRYLKRQLWRDVLGGSLILAAWVLLFVCLGSGGAK
jgi:hypothetical protein